MSNAPFKPESFVQETLQQTTADWATSGNLVLQTYQYGVETDGLLRTKMGDGVTTYANLPFYNPSGQIYSLTTGTPDANDQIAFNSVTAAVAATEQFTCSGIGTAGSNLVVGGKVYTIVASGATGDQINRGASATAYGDNIVAKILTDTATTLCTGTNDSGDVTLTANTAGVAGNSIALFTTDPNITGLSAFTGGVDQVNALKKGALSAFISLDQTPWTSNIDAAGYKLTGAGAILGTNVSGGYRTQATAAGTTTLVATDAQTQVFTGSTTQTVVLPAVATLSQTGFTFLIINQSSGTVTVNANGGSTVQLIVGGGIAWVYNLSISAQSWGKTYLPVLGDNITGSGQWVLGTQPLLSGITLLAGTTGVSPVRYAAGTNLTTPAVGATEFDGASFYSTIDTTSGRGAVPSQNYQRLTSNGSTISTIANFFGANSNISLVASAFYEIDIYAWFLNTTSGTVVWTLTNSAAPTSQNIIYEMSPVTGIVAPPGTATMLSGQIVNDATATKALTATGALTDAVNHYMHMKIWLQNGTGTSLKIQATKSAGTITPLVGSYYTARRLPATSIGTFAA